MCNRIVNKSGKQKVLPYSNNAVRKKCSNFAVI